MAYITQFGTASTLNTNLNTATLVGTFTNTTRVRKLWINMFADQIKGGGDYVGYITWQRAGAGAFYEAIKTTVTVAAGITSKVFPSVTLTVNATDVVKVYLLGTASDNDGTADVIVDVNEEFVDIDTSGRTLLQPTQTGVTIPTVTTLTNAPSNSSGITSILADYARRTGDYSTLTAGSQMDLIDSLKNKVGASGYDRTTDSLEALGEAGTASNPWEVATSTMTTPGSVGELIVADIDAKISSRSTLTASLVWANSTRTLSSFGTLVADIWSYISRTLTEYLTSGSVATNTVSTDITIYGYCTNIITVLNVADTADGWVTIKQNRGQLDSESILQVGKVSGLIYINGQTAIDAGLTSSDATYVVTGGNAIITLSGALAAKLIDRTSLLGELKTKTLAGIITLNSQFNVDIENALTRTI